MAETKPEEKQETLTEKVTSHFIVATSELAPIMPLSALVETQLAGMSTDVSLNARMMTMVAIYFGIGRGIKKGRDYLKKKFNITETTKGGKQAKTDGLSLAAFYLAISPFFYYAAGSRDFEEIAIGTGASIVFGFIKGVVGGYSMDLYQDLTGIEESKRVPEVIRKQKKGVKYAIAAGITALSIGLTAAIYSFAPEYPQKAEFNISETIDSVIEKIYE